MKSEHEKQTRVVLVDDEELVLSALRTLLEINGGFQILEFNEPLQAVEELRRTPVDLVISDYLMPGINGVDLLRQARSLQPEAMRILLTGFADKQNAIRALNEAGVYQYLEKPWDNDQLLIVLRNALQEKGLRQQLTEKVRALDRLIRERDELAERQRHLEQELEMAARVQRSLLPHSFPQIPGVRIDSFYRPCHAIGGDYFDFIRRDGHTWILVSDVSGHGVQAALTSMLMKAIFQDAGAGTEDPAQLFAEMNARLNRFLPEGIYAAAVAVWVDERNCRIRLVNAGLPYPFVLRSGHRRLDEVALPGIPLGMFSGVGLDSYEARPIEMLPGDVLLVASDGLSETQAENGEFFGDRQLRQTLKELNGSDGSELIANLIERADRFSGSLRSTDDVAIVALTRTSP
ncbi:MAG: SpoIIE family protein phosphatase [Acidobacteria bacterium]|nr:SpoIIE family protein phosphatase [Acidobacteriota bacterium]MCI0623946.1 SpoIIE family protein phosphatase [Acidobacteriota bacterium]MCI0718929.1 SpoIIE family protein phosphatase [Acidobacteriota bacterium]